MNDTITTLKNAGIYTSGEAIAQSKSNTGILIFIVSLAAIAFILGYIKIRRSKGNPSHGGSIRADVYTGVLSDYKRDKGGILRYRDGKPYKIG